MIWKPNYSEEEVQVLVENYHELSQYYRHKQYVQVRLMDLEWAIKLLPKSERQAVILCGLLELSSRKAAALLGIPHARLWRRYTKGMTLLFERINGNT